MAPLGIKGGSFRWNSVKQKPVDAEEAQKKAQSAILGGMIPFFGRFKRKGKDGKKAAVSDEESAPTTVNEEGGEAREEAVRFELREIDVVFPEGKLSVVTGPTASGKTALLVCC
jgi:hypothetical protein